MDENKISFFNCKDCMHKNVCKHIEIDVPEFKNKIMECIDNFSYDKSYLCIRIACGEFQAFPRSNVR